MFPYHLGAQLDPQVATGSAISGVTQLTEANKKMMGSNMAKVVPQFLDSFHWLTTVDGMPTVIDGSAAPAGDSR